MTINKLPNQEDVLKHSGLLGRSVEFFNELPTQYGDRATGGSNINPRGVGTTVSAGSNDGDLANLKRPAGSFSSNNIGSYYKITDIIHFTLDDSSPYDNTAYVGYAKGDGTESAAFDVTNEQFIAGNATPKPSGSWDNNTAMELRIEHYPDDGYTDFTLGNSGKQVSKTVNGSVLRPDSLCYLECNGGAGQSITVSRHLVSFEVQG